MFEASVSKIEVGGQTWYTMIDVSDGCATPGAVAIPFSGPGLWGPVKGFIALEPDMRTVRNIIFHEQEETPGLGGEIGSTWFQERFRGRSIVDRDGKPGIAILRDGKPIGPNEVDGITGATMTCEKVKLMLNRSIEMIMQEQKTDAR